MPKDALKHLVFALPLHQTQGATASFGSMSTLVLRRPLKLSCSAACVLAGHR